MKAEKVLNVLNSAVGTAWIQFAMVVLVVAMANYIRGRMPTILAYVEPMAPEPACQEIVVPPLVVREGWLTKRVQPETEPYSPLRGAEADLYIVTGYAVGDDHTAGVITADGRKVRPGITVACPEELTLGTMVYIEGIGARVCEDRGAFEGKWLDLAFETPVEATSFGKQLLAVVIIR